MESFTAKPERSQRGVDLGLTISACLLVTSRIKSLNLICTQDEHPICSKWYIDDIAAAFSGFATVTNDFQPSLNLYLVYISDE